MYTKPAGKLSFTVRQKAQFSVVHFWWSQQLICWWHNKKDIDYFESKIHVSTGLTWFIFQLHIPISCNTHLEEESALQIIITDNFSFVLNFYSPRNMTALKLYFCLRYLICMHKADRKCHLLWMCNWCKSGTTTSVECPQHLVADWSLKIVEVKRRVGSGFQMQ